MIYIYLLVFKRGTSAYDMVSELERMETTDTADVQWEWLETTPDGRVFVLVHCKEDGIEDVEAMRYAGCVESVEKGGKVGGNERDKRQQGRGEHTVVRQVR